MAARGVLYLLLAVLALDLVFGKRRGHDVDARGAMESLHAKVLARSCS